MSVRHERPTVGTNLKNVTGRIRSAEDNDGSGVWVYVDDGSGNPLFTADSPPFQNGWTNVLGKPMVAFKRFQNWIHIRGATSGGSTGTVIFTLPTGWLPEVEETILGAIDGGGSFWTCSIDIIGDVTFVS